MLRLSRFQNGKHAGKCYYYFETKGKEQIVISFLSRNENEESSWLNSGTLHYSWKGNIDSFAEMFRDEFGYEIAETMRMGQKVLLYAPLAQVLQGGAIEWKDLNDVEGVIMRQGFRTDKFYLVKRYRILNPENESYENHIADACTKNGVLQWINILTGEIRTDPGCPGEDWYNYYCEIIQRRTDNPNPYYCWGDKDLTEKFLQFCKTNGTKNEKNIPTLRPRSEGTPTMYTNAVPSKSFDDLKKEVKEKAKNNTPVSQSNKIIAVVVSDVLGTIEYKEIDAQVLSAKFKECGIDFSAAAIMDIANAIRFGANNLLKDKSGKLRTQSAIIKDLYHIYRNDRIAVEIYGAYLDATRQEGDPDWREVFASMDIEHKPNVVSNPTKQV